MERNERFKKDKNLLNDKNMRLNYSSFVYLLLPLFQEGDKLKSLGESVGPRIYEAMHYYKENKSNKRCLTIEEALTFVATTLWTFLFDKASPNLSLNNPPAVNKVQYSIQEAEGQVSKDNKIGGNFYCGVIKSVLNYMGFECDSVDYIGDNKSGIAVYRVTASEK